TESTLLVCFQEAFNLSVDGVTDPSDGLERIWQTSPAGENDWSAIEGASSKWLSISDGIEVDTDYRYVVVCSYSDETDVSDIIQVSLNASPTECVCKPSILTEVRPIVYVNIGDID